MPPSSPALARQLDGPPGNRAGAEAVGGAGGQAGGQPPPPPQDPRDPVQKAMQRLYDHYFLVRDYQRRYPAPNEGTLAFLFRHGAAQARTVLDFGCGDGRYAVPLLESTQAHVTGYDISAQALAQLQQRLAALGLAQRATLLHGPLPSLQAAGPQDLVLMLFGVLSHVGDRAARLAALRQARAVLQPQGRLLLSVPTLGRRRPFEALAAWLRRRTGRAQGPQAEPGNILFSRRLGGVPHEFFYHLYSLGELQQELAEAGFEMTACEAESVLPEWLVTQYRWLGRLDAGFARALPARLGYGMRVCAVPR